MKRILLALAIGAPLTLQAQQLPTGTYHPNRERSYDLIHYKAELRVDWKTRSVGGNATLTLRPLLQASSVTLDAYRLNVRRVRDASSGTPLKFSSDTVSLTIQLGETFRPTDTVSFVVEYSAVPTAGMYFIDACPGTNNQPAIFTYGEGGIHANWLPIYNGNNDKFSTEMVATVTKPHVALSNGRLLKTTENSDGTRTFHWSQTLPHSNYLIALFVGDYREVPLRPAFGTIPLSVWVHPGQERDAATVFERTPDMVEFFSERFNFRYPWDKYDQVSAYDYAIGAMENTGITGHNDRILRAQGQTQEFNPDFESYATNWTTETLISHELAHHWFGNNTTCTNLANIWINESFASYLMMLWDEHRLGAEELQASTWLARQAYLKYVSSSHIIRPLEYRFFDSRSQIYNSETTYLKGAIVLHMMRWILGDEAFFRALSHFQNKHKFSNVESADLKKAIEEATGVNLQYFFEQWMWGGGHPVFEVQSRFIPGRKKVEVKVQQIQPFVEGQDLFWLPVEIRIDAAGKVQRQVVWVDEAEETYHFDVTGVPDMVSFDGRGALVAEIRHKKPIGELLYQVLNDEIPGRMLALEQLVADHPTDPAVVAAVRNLLESDAHWIVKAEAVARLRTIGSSDAEEILLSHLGAEEEHIRKSAVIALGARYTDRARERLRLVAQTDTSDDIAATALVSLAKIDGALSMELLERFAASRSWYDVKRIAALKAMEILADVHFVPHRTQFVPHARRFADTRYHYAVRQQALTTWAACAPADLQLINRLTSFARNDILPVRLTAIEILAQLGVREALPALEEVAAYNGDSDIRHAARLAIEAIQRLSY